jgi:hypothetical protein
MLGKARCGRNFPWAAVLGIVAWCSVDFADIPPGSFAGNARIAACSGAYGRTPA